MIVVSLCCEESKYSSGPLPVPFYLEAHETCNASVAIDFHEVRQLVHIERGVQFQISAQNGNHAQLLYLFAEDTALV